MVSSPTSWPIILAAVLAAIGFSLLEWKRADRRHRPARLAATLLTVAALALLGLRPTWQRATPAASGGVRAVLWTPLVSTASTARVPPPAGIDAKHHFALPAAAYRDPAATLIPDAVFLRRHFPEIDTLRILGDGLDPSEFDALRGLRVEFTPPPPALAAPGLRFLSCPRELPLGDPLVIQGSLGGLVLGTTVTLALESPDATVVHATTSPADAAGEAIFTLRAPSPPAAGRFLWHLRVPPSPSFPALDFPLGVAVIAPDLPRLLILESAPRFDSAALRRWFETAGGAALIRTRLGQDRYRYAATPAAASPPDFPSLDAALLARFDLLLADASAAAALPPVERTALLAAVADTGLGVLILPDDGAPPAEANTLFPWKTSPLPTDTPDPGRTARLQWPGQAAPTDLPVPILPFEIVPGDKELPLLGDHQGHTLAATHPAGRGQLALTLVRDTTRWQRANDPAAFAAYWSFLFSRLARPADTAAGRWSLVDGDAGPVFVDHPLELLWSGPAAHPPGPAVVASPVTPARTTLALAPDPAEPGRWRATFWPRRPGWHRIALASGGPALDFHVGAADAWPALDAARRRAATVRFADASIASHVPPTLPTTRQEFPPAWLALAFFLSAGYLWTERRFDHASTHLSPLRSSASSALKFRPPLP